MALYTEVIESVRNLMKIKDNVIIAIDGRCGSGKSTLSAILAREFDCNVFHMDDFFLPPQMRTAERLSAPGGNVHYERFLDEVITPLLEGRPFCFRPYICSNAAFGEMKCFEKKRLNVVEGSYSLHPSLREAYDLKIFLTLDPSSQERRILQRSGPLKLKDFKSRWIPMEELYFRQLDVAGCCDIVVDTSGSPDQ